MQARPEIRQRCALDQAFLEAERGSCFLRFGFLEGGDVETLVHGVEAQWQEVRFRSRAFSITEIQSEIVLCYLHYLDFCTVYCWWYILMLPIGTRFFDALRFASLWGFSTLLSTVTMPKQLRSKCLRGRQRQLF